MMVLPLLAACAEGGVQESSGGAVEIQVAPLSLPGVTNVEYALAVFNAAPTGTLFAADGTVVGSGNLSSLVWNEPSVTASAYGVAARGDITFIGSCDASAATNHVALALKSITAGGVLDDEITSVDGDPDFINPCDYLAPCVMEVACNENQDTPVTFNLTVIRDAEQGFFDIGVNFKDIFCSAKSESCKPETITDSNTVNSMTVSSVSYQRYTGDSLNYWVASGTSPSCTWKVYGAKADGTVDSTALITSISRDCSVTTPPSTLTLYEAPNLSSTGITGSIISLVFYDGYLGTVGNNTNESNNITTFATLGVKYAVFYQADTDNDGMFDLNQGNDLAGFIQLVPLNSSFSPVNIPTTINFRETTGSKVEVFGIVFPNVATVPLPWTSTNVTGQLTASPQSIGLKAQNSTFTFADSTNRKGNAASINTMLNELNYYLSITPQPTTLAIGTNTTTQFKPVTLLYGSSGAREHTQVFGLACTSSPNSAISTRLLFTEVLIACSNDDDLGDAPEVVYSLPLSTAGAGNELVDPVTAPVGGAYNGLPVAFYYGGEDLNCGAASCNKVYFNVAVNSQWLADKDLVCSMSYSASAIDSNDSSVFTANGNLYDQNGQYPQVKYDGILLTKTVGLVTEAAPNCNLNTLDTAGSKVRVEYIVGNKYGSSAKGVDFDYSFTDSGGVTGLAIDGVSSY